MIPMPPGALPTLWQKHEHFRLSYLTEHPGHYHTSDAGYIDEDGYVWVMSRTDDIINVAGHRLSTGAIEEVVASHPDVAECAVIGVKDDLKGQVPVGLIVLKATCRRPHAEIAAEVIARVRERIGPVACFKHASVVARLPKTRSGKILRGTMRAMADGTPWRIGIQHPRAPGRTIASIRLARGALATSGDYERFFEVDGKRYCHILNPATGWPVQGWQSISVVAPLCVAAGAMSTIAMLHEDAAPAFLAGQQVAWLGVDRNGDVIRHGLPV